MKEGLYGRNRSGLLMEARVGQDRCWFQSVVCFDLFGPKGSQEGKLSLWVGVFRDGTPYPGLPLSKPLVLPPDPAQW